MIKFGSYIGPNIQAVVTSKYTLVFLIEDIVLYSFLLYTSDFSCIHMVRTYKDNSQHNKIDYFITKQGGLNYLNGEKFIKNTKNSFLLLKKNKIILYGTL